MTPEGKPSAGETVPQELSLLPGEIERHQESTISGHRAVGLSDSSDRVPHSQFNAPQPC